MADTDTTSFEELSVAEQILYVQELWDRIAEQPEDVQVTDAQKRELDRRLERMRDEPDETIAWRDVRASIGEDR